ncbi:MAG TPA: hypothetical protein VEJ18_08085, partial [Planctomycetota bacterium]|nr:hypothetical protein [Planctomycetota bacterium]
MLAALLWTALSGTALAQDGDTVIRPGDALAIERDGERLFFLTGGVDVERPDFRMHASRAIVWLAEKGAKAPFQAIYAEGNVIFSRGDQRLRAERFYYNLEQDKAVIINLRGAARSQELGQSVQVGARVARMLGQGRLEAEDLLVSTCPYAVPHYHVSIESAELQGTDPKPVKPGEFQPFPFAGAQVDLQRIVPSFGDAPFLFIPGLSIGSWVKDFPLRGLKYGNTSRFGHAVESEWGYRFRMKDEEGKSRRFAELIGEADWRQKRGWAFGLDVEYDWRPWDVTGFVDTYFLDDQGRDLDVEFELKFPPLRREERGKAHGFHRQDLSEHWRYELEAYYLSDRSLREEFFEEEFKELKDPETAAYVRWLDGPAGAYVLERHRLNDFQTQNEYLPKVAFWLQPTPLLEEPENLFVFQRAEVAHVRRRWDEDLHLETTDTWRFDSTTELTLPYDFHFFQLSPFGMYRMTAYEDDLEGESEVRSIWAVGGRLVLSAHATHLGARSDLLGVRGLRHVAELEARYANAVYASQGNEDLFAFEAVDELGAFEEVALEFRQRFLTKDAAGRAFEFFAVTATIEHYPDSDRDTQSLRVDNTEFPFNWIALAPDAQGAFARRHWSNVI